MGVCGRVHRGHLPEMPRPGNRRTTLDGQSRPEERPLITYEGTRVPSLLGISVGTETPTLQGPVSAPLSKTGSVHLRRRAMPPSSAAVVTLQPAGAA